MLYSAYIITLRRGRSVTDDETRGFIQSGRTCIFLPLYHDNNRQDYSLSCQDATAASWSQRQSWKWLTLFKHKIKLLSTNRGVTRGYFKHFYIRPLPYLSKNKVYHYSTHRQHNRPATVSRDNTLKGPIATSSCRAFFMLLEKPSNETAAYFINVSDILGSASHWNMQIFTRKSKLCFISYLSPGLFYKYLKTTSTMVTICKICFASKP
jgi:hypothetical protein